ncbi:MAG: hypothetical protein JW869_03330 [Candidatus Omnitrophica bacterium]|nr:hypothetical protein [Candidatus Omnitrophota bacterium]
MKSLNAKPPNMIGIWRKFYARPLVKDAFTTTIWNVIGKGIGILIPFFIAAWYGVSVKTDIFFFVYGIVIYLTGVFSRSLESNIVPFIADLRQKAEKKIPDFITKLLLLSFLAMIILVCIFLLLARPLLSLITRFPEGSFQLLLQLFLEISPFLILVVCSSILIGVLNAYFKFWLPAVSPGIRAIVCIATIFALRQKIGIHAIVVGYILGELLRLIVFGYVLTRKKLISLRINFVFDRTIINFFKTLSFQMFGLVAIGLNPVVDKIMASWLTTGSVSVLQYADRLYFIPVNFIASGLIVAVLSHWSEKYYRNKKTQVLKRDMHKAIGIVSLVTISLTVFLSFFARQIVNIAYGRGEFPLEMLVLVKATFLCYLVGITFSLSNQIVIRALLVLKNTKAIMKGAFLSTISNIFLNILLMRFFAVAGIAFATSLVNAASLLFLYLQFKISVRKELT